jgi:hypothetical protein
MPEVTADGSMVLSAQVSAAAAAAAAAAAVALEHAATAQGYQAKASCNSLGKPGLWFYALSSGMRLHRLNSWCVDCGRQVSKETGWG